MSLSLSANCNAAHTQLECYAANYVVSGGQVGMVVTDSSQNVNVFQYAPTSAQR